MTSTVMTRLKKSKEYREAFVASQINVGLPFQIRALRRQNDWNQKELADAAQMLQPRISAMEQPGGGSLNLETLRRLAAAFDVGLLVRFVPFSELVKFSDDFSPDDFTVQSFTDEQMASERTVNDARIGLRLVVDNDRSLMPVAVPPLSVNVIPTAVAVAGKAIQTSDSSFMVRKVAGGK